MRAVLDMYAKHGWLLRRVLLSPESGSTIDVSIFADAEVAAGQLDLAWFSRPPASGEIAWELRFLGDPPIAIVEYLDENAADFTARRSEAERDMAARIDSRRAS